MRAALLNSSGRVDNVIIIDQDSDYTPEAGFTLVLIDDKDPVNMGDLWDDGNWTPPEIPETGEAAEAPISLEDKVAQLQAAVDMLILKALEG